MTVHVLDASVAAKWYLPAKDEPYQQQAIHLLRDYSKGSIQLLTPEIFWLECGNIFRKAARSGRISWKAARNSLAELAEFDIATEASKELLHDAFAIASRFGRTVYDAAYVALAARWEAPLILGTYSGSE